jgi:hypothetical protein
MFTTCENPLQDIINKDVTTEAPSAPSGLKATAESDTQIDLAWKDESENEDEFQIQRKKPKGDDWETIDTVGADRTAYSDEGLNEQTEYMYRLRAVNSLGESDWSSEDNATTKAAPRFSVIYNDNGAEGGTAPVDEKSYKEGDMVTISGQGTLFRSDHTLIGWNTLSNGGGDSYQEGHKLSMPRHDVILYAQWGLNHTVTYNGNGNTGGAVPVDNNIYFNGATVTVLGNTGDLINMDGATTAYYFDGWKDGGGTYYPVGSNFQMGTIDIVLYAQWTPYEIRDVGPAEGWVFYDKGSYSSGWRYIEAYPSDLDASGDYFVEYGGFGTDINGNNSAAAPEFKDIGRSYVNTNIIVSTLGDNGGEPYAAKLCYDLSDENGVDDWLLPTVEELVEMHQILYLSNIGGFSAQNYWSSSENDGMSAWYRNFSVSGTGYNGTSKHIDMRVRAVRYF